MKKFKNNRSFSKKRDDNRFGRRSSFGDKVSFGKSHPDNGSVFPAQCAKCGKSCQVPFRPNGKKPVFCNDCFGSGDRSSRELFAPRDGFRNKNRDERPARDSFVPKQESFVKDPNTDRIIEMLQDISGKLEKMIATMNYQPEKSVENTPIVPISKKQKDTTKPVKKVAKKSLSVKKIIKSPAKKTLKK